MRWGRLARLAGVAAVGAAGGLAAVSLAPAPSGDVGPGQMSLRARPALRGTSSLALPPFGEVTARTHVAPLRLELRVDELDLDDLATTLQHKHPEKALRADVEDALGPLLRQFALRTIVAALLGALLAAAVLPQRAPHRFLVAGGGSTVVVITLLVWSWAGYDTRAFDTATFVGPLERAPSLLAAVQRRVGGIEEVSNRVKVLSQQVSAMYEAVEAEPVSSDTTILHISDIHSNPLGLEIAQQLTETFDVDAVLDTGDLTSFGAPVESRITSLIDDFDVPYLYVGGNHDSSANRRAIASTPGVVALDGQIERVRDVRIVGFPDPTFTADNRIDTAEGNARRVARAGLVADRVRALEPDIVAVHDERQGSACYGLTPVLVLGHTHERDDRVVDGTRVLTVGSTGATGLGAFTVDTGHAYEAELLRFDGEDLVAVDYVTLDGVSGEFSVQRELVAPSAVSTTSTTSTTSTP
jgi:predicted phosphodiesterase